MTKRQLYIESILKVILIAIIPIFLWFLLGINGTIIGFIYLGALIGAGFVLASYFIEDHTIRFIKLKHGAKIPTRRLEDGCYDLYACIDDDIIIQPHTTALVPTGIASVFDKKYRIAFRERGSNTKWNGIIMAGQIDSNYRGEYFIAVHNAGNQDIGLTNDRNVDDIKINYKVIVVPVRKKALCQFAVEYVPKVYITEEGQSYLEAHTTERGTGKLGSSGK